MNELQNIDNFFSSHDVNDDIFCEKKYVSFYLNIEFKIIEFENKYVLTITKLLKKEEKTIPIEIKDNFLKLFPINIRKIHNIELCEYQINIKYEKEFLINCCIDDNIFDIFINN